MTFRKGNVKIIRINRGLHNKGGIPLIAYLLAIIGPDRHAGLLKGGQEKRSCCV